MSVSSVHMNSSSFSWVVSSSSLWGSLGIGRGLASGSGKVGGMGDITNITVDQSVLRPLKLEMDPNTQITCTQGEEQIKTLNKFASFIDKVWLLEQKMLETKRSLLQQQKTPQSNVDGMFESYQQSSVAAGVNGPGEVEGGGRARQRAGMVEDSRDK